MSPLVDGEAGDPRVDRRLEFRFVGPAGRLDLVNAGLSFVPRRFFGWRRQFEWSDIGAVKKGVELVILALRQRIEFVAVTLGTADRQSQKDSAGRVDLIEDRLVPYAWIEHRIAMKRAGDGLLHARVGQLIAGDLLDRELIERLVTIDRPDHPIAITPHAAGRVGFVTAAVGIAGQVEPMPPPPLAEMGRRQQPVDQPLVGVRGRIGGKAGDFVSRRQESREVEPDAASQRRSVCLGGRLEMPSASSRDSTNESISLRTQPLFLTVRGFAAARAV